MYRCDEGGEGGLGFEGGGEGGGGLGDWYKSFMWRQHVLGIKGTKLPEGFYTTAFGPSRPGIQDWGALQQGGRPTSSHIAFIV
ncbi:hypothetical protein EVAR_23694_1 [Eumeta japonica]|uniref:Uncharacterized protein n=1 Tax=Eumeta variegata TaxID=151549 RepID=A0A4C1VJL9_EUMVA|nr:hypothetical protein EVAR_23694_1 [Eumeta japonica]